MSDSEIHVGSGRRKFDKKLLLKRFLIGTGLVVLVAGVAGGAGVGLRWLQTRQEKKQATTSLDNIPATVTKEASEAQELSAKGEFGKAHDTINKALENSNLSDGAKYELHMQQGITYENETNYDAAMESYKKAESVHASTDAAQSIARMYEAKGDKSSAITYYKKAITLIPKDDAMYEATKKFFENTIIVLEGGQPKYE